jgi:Protein of unknown function (DUF3455)
MLKFSSWLDISLIVSLISLGLCDVARSNVNDDSQVPKNLQVPTEQRILLKTAAQGSQIYTCHQLADKSSQFKWTLKAPDAKLFNSQGKALGKHYAGPSWEANDGSKITAVVKAKENAPNGSIPWLLLQVKSSQGNGIFANVKWIQRLHTTGGTPPTQNCDRDHQNADISVSYTADYYFYSPTAREN